MVNLNNYVKRLTDRYQIEDPEFMLAFTKFIEANNWFGEKPSIKPKGVYVSNDFVDGHEKQIENFVLHYNDDSAQKVDYLSMVMKQQLPQTYKYYAMYSRKNDIPKDISYVLMDFLLYNLPGELAYSSDPEINSLLEEAYNTLPRFEGSILTDFINWMSDNKNIRTSYFQKYFLGDYMSQAEKAYAYDEDYYLQIMYYLFNQDYIEENCMYQKAAESKNYVDTWLFISLHFICALRKTDMFRIPHPILPLQPEVILEQVEQGTFSEKDAKFTLYSITEHLMAMHLTPHKTQGTSGVGDIKFHVPVSLETHMGTLFAIAEAHFQLKKLDPAQPLIREINTYEQIKRYMGEEIGELFLEGNFRSRSANKSYLQMIYMLTDDVLDDENDEFHTNGYILAALARSHKGSYGEFAEQTKTYLKDAKMSGYSPEFIAKELLERGVLSSVVSMLMKIVTHGQYEALSVKNQTKLIEESEVSPLEAEQSVRIMQDSVKKANEIVQKIYQATSEDELRKILHRIGDGEAVSKTDGSFCLITAMQKVCPYKDRTSCIGCPYEVGTKTTIFLMASEIKRLQKLYRKTDNSFEKRKYKNIAANVIAPKMNELIVCMGKEYGEEAVHTMESIIREVIDAG